MFSIIGNNLFLARENMEETRQQEILPSLRGKFLCFFDIFFKSYKKKYTCQTRNKYRRPSNRYKIKQENHTCSRNKEQSHKYISINTK